MWPATPVAVSAADKQLKVEVTSVQLPSHGLLPAEDQVAVHVWLTIKDCPPVGKLVATANGVEMSEWGRGGLMVQSPFASSAAVSPQCIPWGSLPPSRAWLGPGPALR